MLSNWAYINYHHQSILFVTSFATNGSYCSIHMWFLSPGCLFSCFSLLLVASRDATVCLPVGAAMLWCSMWSALGFWWVCCRGFANLFLFGLVLARFASLVVSIMAYGSDTLLGFALCWALDFLPQLLLCFCMASLVVSLIRGCFLCLVPFMHLALVFSIGQGCLGRHLGCCERWILTNIANIYNCYFQVEWFSCACWTPCLGFFWGGVLILIFSPCWFFHIWVDVSPWRVLGCIWPCLSFVLSTGVAEYGWAWILFWRSISVPPMWSSFCSP